MNLCVKKERTIMSDANSKLYRNEKLKNLAEITCKDFAREFVTATQNRQNEIATLIQIIEIVKKRFGHLDSQVLKQINNLNKSLKVYVNNTEFKKYQEYVKVRIVDNNSGSNLVNTN